MGVVVRQTVLPPYLGIQICLLLLLLLSLLLLGCSCRLWFVVKVLAQCVETKMLAAACETFIN